MFGVSAVFHGLGSFVTQGLGAVLFFGLGVAFGRYVKRYSWEM